MKYLCLVYAEEERIAALSGEEWDALVAENLALCEELRRSGHYVGGAPLDSVETAATVRVRHGRPVTTDGPFAETKEQLGGYYLIEARDLDEATRVAGRIPGARFGSVEVRRLVAHDPREPWLRRDPPAPTAKTSRPGRKRSPASAASADRRRGSASTRVRPSRSTRRTRG